MAAPTKKDWGAIHAMAWRDASFRKLLESDPTKAIQQYAKETGKTFDKVMKVTAKPKGVASADLHKHVDATQPPACC